MSRRVLAAGAIAVLVIALAGAYVVASLTEVAADHHDATAVLAAVGKRNNQVYSALADPALHARLSNPGDVKTLAGALDDLRARLGGSERQVEGELADLRDQESRLRRDRGSAFTLVGRAQLDQDLARITAARHAFAAADHLLSTEDAHMKAVNTIVGAVLKLDNVSAWVRAGNVPQAAALVPSVKQTLQDATTLTQGSGYPPQLRPVIDALKQLVDHFGSLLDAVVAGDLPTAQAMASVLDGDSSQLESSFDVDAFTSFERTAVAPDRATYEREMAKAGFRLTSPSGS